ncbi:MAG: hypothetical protein HY820_14035 [Acidobacteria bacterium]|nr:hypothetical protein [Acidobacteriota bacterium]
MPARIVVLVLAAACLAQSGEFSGVWTLNATRSVISPQAAPPGQILKIEHEANTVLCTATGTPGAAPVATSYTTDGKESKSTVGGVTRSSVVKWEGSALLVNTIVREDSGQYVIMERWRASRDGATLTIRRQIQRNGSESESTLIYEKDGARPVITEAQPAASQPILIERQAAPRRLAARPPEAKPAKEEYAIDAGTKVPVRLRGSLTSKSAQLGDKVYLETVFPVVSEGRLIIPIGTEVVGVVSHVKRPGRRSGRGELAIRFETLTMSNGITRDLRAPIGGMDGNSKGELDRDEGIVKSESGKGRDAKTVGKTTAAGASVGSVAGAATGRWGTGVGIGAAGGAAAGALGTMMQRGPDAVLPSGTILEMVLDRTLQFKVAELVY